MKASRPANRLPRAEADPDPDPLQLSRLLLGLRGVCVLGRVRNTPALPLDLVGVDLQGWPVLAAVLSGAAPAERLDLFVRLLGRDDLADMVRRGVRLEVHAWSRSRCWAVDVVRLGEEDFPA
jgi:hypothetical protein